MQLTEFEDGTGSRRPQLGDAGMSPRQILFKRKGLPFLEALFLFDHKIKVRIRIRLMIKPVVPPFLRIG